MGDSVAEMAPSLFFAFEEYGSDSTCTGQAYGADQVKNAHAHAFGHSYLQYLFSDGDSSPEALDSLEVSPNSGDPGAAKTAIASSPTDVMPQFLGRCFESEHMAETLPDESRKAFYSWGCGTGNEMMLLGFDTIDACRDAFYCSVKNPVGVMQGEAPDSQDDPIESCKEKLVPAMVPFLTSDQDTKLDAGTPYLSVQAPNPPCVQVPLGAHPDSSAYRIYMGCTRTVEEIKFSNPANLSAGIRGAYVFKYDPRGEGIWNLQSNHKAGVYAANFLGWTLCFCLICLAARPIIRDKLKEKKQKSVAVKHAGEV